MDLCKRVQQKLSLTHKGLENDCLLIQQPVVITSQSILYSFSSITSYTGALYILNPLYPPSIVPAGLIALMDLLAVLSSASDHQPQ